MRVAHNDISLINSFHAAKTEAEKAFGNAGVYIEKFIEVSHHVEFQILADTRGNVIHLGERDCSIQRRNQKLIEETPSPLIGTRFKDLRKKMSKAAIAIAKAANYNNAGTVEFIVSEKGEFYFLEMNKRIQVEHPVTEFVTGIDIVKVLKTGIQPTITTGMAHKDPGVGQVGAGIVKAPLDCFVKAAEYYAKHKNG